MRQDLEEWMLTVGHIFNLSQRNLIYQLIIGWYAQGKRDGVEEYTTGTLKGDLT